MVEINFNDENYPEILKNIKNPPKKLYILGDVELLNKNLIAVVGSRNFTEYGKRMTKKFVKELVDNGLGIVSGLALGIDSFAHIEAIKNGGKTIAVLGCGFNNIYPKENEKLFYEILDSGGTIISEYAPQEEVKKANFPKRNRIISGISVGTIVIEASYRSGTSITANYAIKQGKKVFCIPNSLENTNSVGIINLIQNGALIVKNANDIFKGLNQNNVKLNNKIKTHKVAQNVDINVQKLNELGKEIYDFIKDNEKVSCNNISNTLKLKVEEVNEWLSILEIDGLIENVGGNKFMIVNTL